MKLEFTHREGKGKLILIFAGWGTDAVFYSHIQVPGYDIVVVSGYTDKDFPVEILDNYHTVCLFAWSLGVVMASRTVPFDKLAMAVAVNGTETPVSDTDGIPSAIYDGTLNTLNERNLTKFRRRMALEKFDAISDKLPVADIPLLKDELEFIRALSATPYTPALWDRAYISKRDNIFASANLLKAWNNHPGRPEIVTVDGPHYIDLGEIISGIIPHPDKVGKRFSKASHSYDSHAVAQKQLARMLADSLPAGLCGRVLEIGPGTGLFTEMYLADRDFTTIDFVDLSPCPPLLEGKGSWHQEDAEEWLANEAEAHPGTYDAILSSSAVQWFVNPRRFLANAARLLKPGGTLAFTTYAPGNLNELLPFNPYGLLYRWPEHLQQWARGYYTKVNISTHDTAVDFDDSRQTLMHLHRTGVGGSAKSPLPTSRLMAGFPQRLTYRAIIMNCMK